MKEGAFLSKPVKTINWTLFAALLVLLFVLLVLSRCHPNVLQENTRPNSSLPPTDTVILRICQ